MNPSNLKINTYTINQYNYFDYKERVAAFKKLYHEKEEDIKDEKVETEQEMQIVKWGERLYLLNYADLYKFAAAVNLGIEPRRGIIYRDFLSTGFYLRKEDKNKTINGKPKLPDEWLSYIFDSPIKVSITKIERGKGEIKYIVNKGSADRLKVGMCFVGRNAEVDYDNLLWVDSVKKHSANLKNHPFISPSYKVGDILTTKSYKNVK